jgi:hypothetical protein
MKGFSSERSEVQTTLGASPAGNAAAQGSQIGAEIPADAAGSSDPRVSKTRWAGKEIWKV